MEQVEEFRKVWDRRRGVVTEEERRLAEAYAVQATERIRSKIKMMMEARDSELQLLVEGQKNSIDAIRLKEYLVLRQPNVKLGRSYTERDRLRVEELLASS